MSKDKFVKGMSPEDLGREAEIVLFEDARKRGIRDVVPELEYVGAGDDEDTWTYRVRWRKGNQLVDPEGGPRYLQLQRKGRTA